MRILISNDDGIHAPGIHALVQEVSGFGDIYVVAPHRQRSASSHGISLYDPLYVETVDFGMPNVHAYSLTGTPVDCVKWAISTFHRSEPFDVMFSGINEGPNLATDVLYSGTVAAAGEAGLQGIPSFAISLAGPPFPFTEAARKMREWLPTILSRRFPADTFLNINLPGTNLQRAKWTSCVLGARGFTDTFHQRTDTAGKTYYKYAGEELEETGGPATDVLVVREGNISVTPLRYRFTNDEMIDTLSTWIQMQGTTTNRS